MPHIRSPRYQAVNLKPAPAPCSASRHWWFSAKRTFNHLGSFQNNTMGPTQHQFLQTRPDPPMTYALPLGTGCICNCTFVYVIV